MSGEWELSLPRAVPVRLFHSAACAIPAGRAKVFLVFPQREDSLCRGLRGFENFFSFRRVHSAWCARAVLMALSVAGFSFRSNAASASEDFFTQQVQPIFQENCF